MRKATVALIIGLALLVSMVGCGPKPPPAVVPPVVPVVNQAPVAYAPFTATMSFSSGARIDYDLRYRLHGCENGMPETVTGARDPDGDALEYQLACRWSVFNATYEKINGQWLTFPKDDRGEQVAIVTLFIGWEGVSPPYQFTPKCLLNEVALGCAPIPPVVPFIYMVRDGKGGMASHTVTLQ